MRGVAVWQDRTGQWVSRAADWRGKRFVFSMAPLLNATNSDMACAQAAMFWGVQLEYVSVVEAPNPD
jgi:hypothetical protein